MKKFIYYFIILLFTNNIYANNGWERLPTNSEIDMVLQNLKNELTISMRDAWGDALQKDPLIFSPIIKYHHRNYAHAYDNSLIPVIPHVEASGLIVIVRFKEVPYYTEAWNKNFYLMYYDNRWQFQQRYTDKKYATLEKAYNSTIADLKANNNDLGFALPLLNSKKNFTNENNNPFSNDNKVKIIETEKDDDDGLWIVALGALIGTIVAGVVLRRKRLKSIEPNKKDKSKEKKKKKAVESQEKDLHNDKPITVEEAIENVNAPSMIPGVDNTVNIVKKGAKDLSEIVDKNAENVANTLKDALVNPEDGGLISNADSKNVDRLKGVKSVLENGSDLILDRLTKTQVDLHDIHSLKKIFDKNGNAIINNMDDVKKYADLLKKNDKRIKNLTKSSKAKKLFKAAGFGFEFYDAVDRVYKVTKDRGYTKEDAKWANTSEFAHKVALELITRNPIVGVVDGVVSIIAPDYNVENIMRKGEDAWHKESEEFFKNIYDNSDELAAKQLKEFNRFKKRIMSKNISEEEKLKKIKKIYKIVVG